MDFLKRAFSFTLAVMMTFQMLPIPALIAFAEEVAEKEEIVEFQPMS